MGMVRETRRPAMKLPACDPETLSANLISSLEAETSNNASDLSDTPVISYAVCSWPLAQDCPQFSQTQGV
jgi:hypothetical protein